MTGCYSCGSDMEPIRVRWSDFLLRRRPRMPSILVYPTTSRGLIAFCDLCFETQAFRDLADDDIRTLNWFFGVAYAEGKPARAISLLEPMLQDGRAPDILSPLGRAYISAGRIEEGTRLLREAAAFDPNHPYILLDQEALRGA
jgi:hypothetical protein